MSMKSKQIAGLLAALLLLLSSGAASYASEAISAANTQAQAVQTATSQTIVAGAATIEKKNAGAAKAKEAKTIGFSEEGTLDETTPDESLAEASADTAGSGPTLISLGIFKTTGYCPCYSCSEGWGRRTSTGAVASSNHTIAVDPRVIPYGSKVMINGIVYTAEDRGGAVRGSHIDIFYDTHAQANQHGVRKAEVFLVK